MTQPVVWRRSILALTLCLTTIMAVAQTPDTLSLSLELALRIALERNASIETSRLDVRKAELDKRIKLAQLFPNINASVGYQYALKKQKVYFGSENADPNNPMSSFMPAEGIEMGQNHSIQAGISAQLPLVAPQLWASLKLDKISVENALESARKSRVDLTAELRKAYMAVLLATDNKQVLEKSLAQLKENREIIKQKYDRGLVAEYDLVRMEAQVQNLIPQVISAEQNVRLATMKLLVLMNVEPTMPVKPEEELSDYTGLVYSRILSRGDSISLESNTTLRSLDLASKQLDQALKVSKLAFLPTLGMSFAYNYSFMSDYLKLTNSKRWSPMSNIGLQLSIPLFAGGARYYGVKSAQVQIDRLAIQRKEAERQLRLGLVNALAEQSNAAGQFVASGEAVKSAQKGLEIAEVRYRTGNSTILELNDAELALRQAQLNLSQAIYAYMIATYNIEQIEGREASTAE